MILLMLVSMILVAHLLFYLLVIMGAILADRRVKRLVSEVEGESFIMRPAKWLWTFSAISAVLGMSGTLLFFLDYEGNFGIVWAIYALVFTGLAVFLALFPSMEWIVVQGSTVTWHYYFIKVYQFDFAEISKVRLAKSYASKVKCYNADGEVILEFDRYWKDYDVMVEMLGEFCD